MITGVTRGEFGAQHFDNSFKGNGMSICPTLAVYFLVQKELGKKALYPGNIGSYKGVIDTSNADKLAHLAVHSSTLPQFENQGFVHIDHNSEHNTWEQIWKSSANYFGVEVEEQTFPLTKDKPRGGKKKIGLY